MRSAEAPCQLHNGPVHVGRKLRHSRGERPTPRTMPPEDNREARDEISNDVVIEVSTRPRTEDWNRSSLQGCEIRAAVVLPHAVEQQCHLAVVGYYAVLQQKLDQVREA